MCRNSFDKDGSGTLDATEFQNVVATLRRNGNQTCAATPIDPTGAEEMVARDIDSEVDGALVEDTRRIQQSNGSFTTIEGCRQRQVDDGLESPRGSGAEVRLATIPQSFGRGRAMAIQQP
eukprot:SAG31_NODE_15610_length_746_cov_2.876352_1_plen_120_part_00